MANWSKWDKPVEVGQGVIFFMSHFDHPSVIDPLKLSEL